MCGFTHIYIYMIYIKNVIRYMSCVLCIWQWKKERICERTRGSERERERERRSEGECASATFILCCARKNVNYSKVRPAITYHLLFQIITVCSKCNIKKKRKLQISWNKIFCAETWGRIIIPDVFSAEERWKTYRVVLLWIKFLMLFLSYIYKKNLIWRCDDEKASKSKWFMEKKN